jgi:soluble lytic murein transglycosylase-like protein
MHLLRVIVAVLGIAGPLACLADAGIYAFVDAQGEVHLSNVPDDDRYHRLDAPFASIDAKAREAAPRSGSIDPGGRRQFGEVITQAAGRYGIDAALLHAVISVESGYNAKAVSKRGAAGLMQLMPGTARRYGVADVFDPADNVRAGAQYLNDLLKLFDNDVRLALAAYNAGENAVLKHGRRIPPYRETIAYVPRVVDFYNRFRALM